MRFYPMYLTEYEIEIIVRMIEAIENYNDAVPLDDEEKRIKQILVNTLAKIKEHNDGD